MAIAPRDLPDLVDQRAESQKALDRFGALSTTYQAWHNTIRQQYDLYAGNWGTVWPDNKSEFSQPKIPDYVRLAAEDRSRSAAATRPSIVCRPPKIGDAARQAADKRERITNYFWDNSRVMSLIPRWAFDSMFGGVTICQVWPDFAKPRAERFPVYTRLEPTYCFPDPAFAQGPYVDSMVLAYEDYVRTIERTYDKTLDLPGGTKKDSAKVRVIKYFDGEQVLVVAEHTGMNGMKKHTVLVNEKHRLECCPVVIGVRPTADGLYHGEFDNAMDLTNFGNQFATILQTYAIRATWPKALKTPGVDSDEEGPDGEILLETPQDRYELVQQPNQPFTNIQTYRGVLDDIRTTVIMPPARSGNPDESIISAAGISAAAGQYFEAVSSLQRDVLKPMLEAANAVAAKVDVEYSGDVIKTIYGKGKGQETYNPSKDIGGYTRSEVVYSNLSAVDEINRSVMFQQQHGQGIIPWEIAAEQSAFVEDVSRAKRLLLDEQLDKAMQAGLIAQAANGGIDAATVARIKKAIRDEDQTLEDAIAENTPVAPLAQPVGSAPVPNAPGISGAQEAREPGPAAPDLAALGLL
jgi:hypothetical protein